MQKVNFLTYTLILIMASALITSCSSGSSSLDKSAVLPDYFIFQEHTPGFESDVFELRRTRFMEKMGGEAAIISASAGVDFVYLTGMTGDRQAVALLDPASSNPFTLFVMPREPMSTLWDGERPGVEGAVETYGANAAYSVRELDSRLPNLLTGKRSVSMHRGDAGLRERVVNAGKISADNIQTDMNQILAEMRVVKDSWEVAQLNKAIKVTGLAHQRVLHTVKPGMKEYDVQAEIEYVFMKNGLTTGFSSIVGSGPNAAILHYVENNRTLEEGDLLLMDIGAKSMGYIADVTRTIPVSGKFSPEQKELYTLVLKASDEGIKQMVSGNMILDCHHTATAIIVRGLYDIGLITDTTSWWQKRFYIQYRNNHYIGLAVHDVGSYGNLNAPDRDSYIINPEIRGREIIPGMVMTFEPGVYLLGDRLDHLHSIFGNVATAEELDEFAEKVRPVYEKYAGIGIRIEDDILITETGNINLSSNAPKTVEEIESIMQSRK